MTKLIFLLCHTGSINLVAKCSKLLVKDPQGFQKRKYIKLVYSGIHNYKYFGKC